MPISLLAQDLVGYVNALTNQAKHEEFLDIETAQRAAKLCEKLLAALPDRPDERQHRLAQLAIKYFILAEDAEDDNQSLIGFDDDLQVVVAVIEELGLSHLLEDDPTDG